MHIVDDHHLDIQFLNGQSSQLLNIHLETSVTIDIDDRFFRQGGFGAHGCGKSEAHGTQTSGSEKLTGEFVVVELGTPHLMLSHAGDDHSIAPGHPGKGLDDLLGMKSARLLFKCKRILFLPLPDFCKPGGALLELRLGVHHFEDLFHIRKDPQIGDFVFVDF